MVVFHDTIRVVKERGSEALVTPPDPLTDALFEEGTPLMIQSKSSSDSSQSPPHNCIYVLVTGSRYARLADWRWTIMDALQEHVGDKPYQLVHGAATGIDQIAAHIATSVVNENNPDRVHRFPADWKAHGKAAGPKRNQQMLDFILDSFVDGDEVVCLAFHDDLGNSKGTRDMVRRAKAAGIPVHVYDGKGAT